MDMNDKNIDDMNIVELETLIIQRQTSYHHYKPFTGLYNNIFKTQFNKPFEFIKFILLDTDKFITHDKLQKNYTLETIKNKFYGISIIIDKLHPEIIKHITQEEYQQGSTKIKYHILILNSEISALRLSQKNILQNPKKNKTPKVEKSSKENEKTEIEKSSKENEKTEIEKSPRENEKTEIEKISRENEKTEIENSPKENEKTEIEKSPKEIENEYKEFYYQDEKHKSIFETEDDQIDKLTITENDEEEKQSQKSQKSNENEKKYNDKYIDKLINDLTFLNKKEIQKKETELEKKEQEKQNILQFVQKLSNTNIQLKQEIEKIKQDKDLNIPLQVVLNDMYAIKQQNEKMNKLIYQFEENVCQHIQS